VQTRTRAMTVEKETFVKLMKVGSFVPEECVLSALRRSVAHLFSPSLICSPCLPPLSSLTFALSLSPVDHPLCLCVCVSVHLRFSLSLSPLTQTRFSTIRNKNTKKHIQSNKTNTQTYTNTTHAQSRIHFVRFMLLRSWRWGSPKRKRLSPPRVVTTTRMRRALHGASPQGDPKGRGKPANSSSIEPRREPR
jgi:hypothetical protein